MERRKFIKVAGLSAFSISSTGFSLLNLNGKITTDCATSRDMLGPFFRPNAPYRNDLKYLGNDSEVPVKVIGQVFGTDCETPLKDVVIDIWHCDHKKDYNMDAEDFKCRGKITTDENGAYWFETFIPPPYGGRPKHIHYLVDNVEGYERLATQLYFRGDKKIKPNNWVKYRWDDRRILEIYKNENNESEVKLDLYLTPKGI